MQVDWEGVAKGDAKMGAQALEARDRARKSILATIAPTSVLNDWQESGEDPSVSFEPIGAMHPITARGIVEFVEDPGRQVSKRAWLRMWRGYGRVRATAALYAESDLPRG